MSAMTTGEKIKALRIEKGITQKELCGSHMTRNMLSLIESGRANPSVSTLEYIAEKLGVPSGYLLNDGGELFDFLKLKLMPEIRRLYSEHQWRECVDLCRSLPHTDDETNMILADCRLEIGIARYNSGRLEAAYKSFSLVEEHAKKTVYRCADTVGRAKIYIELIDSLLQSRHADVSASTVPEFEMPFELAAYTNLLRITDSMKYEDATRIYDSVKLDNPLYRTHISARLSVSAGNYARGISLYREIESRFDGENADAVFRYIVYRDLELACRTIGDFKGAYEYSEKKQSLYSVLGLSQMPAGSLGV